MVVEEGQIVRIFFKNQVGSASCIEYTDIHCAKTCEVGLSAVVVHKLNDETIFYPLLNVAAVKIMTGVEE